MTETVNNLQKEIEALKLEIGKLKKQLADKDIIIETTMEKLRSLKEKEN